MRERRSSFEGCCLFNTYPYSSSYGQTGICNFRRAWARNLKKQGVTGKSWYIYCGIKILEVNRFVNKSCSYIPFRPWIWKVIRRDYQNLQFKIFLNTYLFLLFLENILFALHCTCRHCCVFTFYQASTNSVDTKYRTRKSKYSQTCLRRPLSGPLKSDYLGQVVVKHL